MTEGNRRGTRRQSRRITARLTIATALCALAPLAGAASAHAAPVVSASDVSVTEPTGSNTTATFTISLSEPSLMPVTVDVVTGTGTAGSADFGRRTVSTLSFAPGQTSKPYNVTVYGDNIDEDTETFFVQLSNPTGGASVTDAFGEATITDDDEPSAISINDVSINEPGATYQNATFTVSLNRRSEKSISVRVDTAAGTANGADYSSRSNVTLLFPPGTTSRTVSVPVRPGDSIDEDNETFHLDASQQVNATLADGRGTATIIDDDLPPTISINDVTKLEPHPTYDNAVFTLTLSQPSSRTITVNASTAADTATTADFSPRNSVAVTFPAGATSRQFAVPIRPDFTDEFDEKFNVNLSGPANASLSDGTGVGTITDDDLPPDVSIGDVTVVEPFTGETSARVAITLNRASGKPVTVTHQTSDNSATGGSDYQARTNSVTIPAGNTQTTVGVNVFADNFRETDETFNRGLTAATNATINDGFGLTTISANCYDKEPSTAPTAMDLGSIASDAGDEQVVSPAGASICANDVDWYKVQLRETDQVNNVFHSAALHLDVPDVLANGDIDMHVYDDEGDAVSYDSSVNPGTNDEDLYYWYDDTALDDTAYFWVQIEDKHGVLTPQVNDYTLTVTGNQ